MSHRNRWFTVLNSMVIFHGYVSHNQMVDSPNGGFTAFFSKIQGVAWGKLLRENPGSKPIKNHPFSVFPEKIPLGSCSVQFWDTTVWKIWNCLPASVANPANLLCVDFTFPTCFTDSQKRRVASESSRHCSCQNHARSKGRKKCENLRMKR